MNYHNKEKRNKIHIYFFFEKIIYFLKQILIHILLLNMFFSTDNKYLRNLEKQQ